LRKFDPNIDKLKKPTFALKSASNRLKKTLSLWLHLNNALKRLIIEGCYQLFKDFRKFRRANCLLMQLGDNFVIQISV